MWGLGFSQVRQGELFLRSVLPLCKFCARKILPRASDQNVLCTRVVLQPILQVYYPVLTQALVSPSNWAAC